MTDLLSTAQSLIVRLAAPPQAHSVWIRNVDPDSGEHVQALCVSIRPEWKDRIAVPRDHMGVPVVEVPWPRGS